MSGAVRSIRLLASLNRRLKESKMNHKHTAYKLIDQNGYTRYGMKGETKWLPIDKVVEPIGAGTTPCGPGVLHGYISPEVAMLANPMHAAIPHPRLLRIESDQTWHTDGLKRWTNGKCRVVEELPLPQLTLEDRVAWVICLSAHESTREWAIKWLSGQDRTARAAWAAVAKAAWAARRTARAAAVAATRRATVDAAALAAADAAWAAQAEAATARTAAMQAEAEANLMPCLKLAQEILSGRISAEQYDKPGR
jgi:hypothetical protein